MLDADLRLLATVEVESRWRLTRGVAVDGDQVVVLRGCDADAVSGLRLLDLDGGLVRTIADGRFIDPQAVAASRGRAYVLDQDGDERAVTDAEPEAEPDAMDDTHACTGRSAPPRTRTLALTLALALALTLALAVSLHPYTSRPSRLVLYVIDLESGDLFQTVRFKRRLTYSECLLVDGDDIYIADPHACRVRVLRFAGPEA